jgi:hypothetical protein
MTIATLDQYIAAVKQRIEHVKTVSRTTVAAVPFSVFDIAGQPGAGTLPGTSTAAGVVPTSSTSGCPAINFSSGTGYLSKVEFNNSVTCRLALFDMLFKAGAYSYAAGTTSLSGQPSFMGRVPDGVGNGNEIWIEVSTAFVTGTAWQVQITYTNQAGISGQTSIISPAQAAAGLSLGKLFQIALASGDSGVQAINSVIVTNGGTAMTAGAFNVLVLRPLWTSGRVPIANGGDVHDMLRTGLPIVYNTSAFYIQVCADSTGTGTPELNYEIASA